jgi:hypothetical protein
MDKICWDNLSSNPNAISLLEQNMDKVYWDNFYCNPNAIHLLEKHMDKIHIDMIDWDYVSMNPNAIHLLEKHVNMISWDYLSQNPDIFTYDYEKMKNQMKISGIAEELAAKVFCPMRLMNLCNTYNVGFDDLLEIY